MPNQFYTDMKTDRKGSPKSGGKSRRASGESFTEKPGFSTGVPGKTQPGKRSGGVKKCPIYPASEGL